MLTKDKSKLLALPNSLILGDSSTKNQNPLRHTDFVETAQAASYNRRESLVPMNMVSTSEFRASSPARRCQRSRGRVIKRGSRRGYGYQATRPGTLARRPGCSKRAVLQGALMLRSDVARNSFVVRYFIGSP